MAHIIYNIYVVDISCIFLAPLYSTDSYVTRLKFVREIVNNKNDNFVMASFDVESLFTNVPVQETEDIILESNFPSQTLFSWL